MSGGEWWQAAELRAGGSGLSARGQPEGGRKKELPKGSGVKWVLIFWLKARSMSAQTVTRVRWLSRGRSAGNWAESWGEVPLSPVTQ